MRSTILGLLTLAAATPAVAQARGEKESRRGGAAVQVAVEVGAWSDQERRLILEYYRDGRSRPKPLPPGIARNLARGKPLPPGIAKQALPADLLRRLPAREGVERVLAGDQVLLIRAGIVIDVLALFR